MSNDFSVAPSSQRLLVDALFLGVIVLLVALIFGATVYETAQIALRNDDYSHGLLLPAVVTFLLWDRRRLLREAHEIRSQSIVWALMLTLGLLLFLVGFSSELHFPMWVALFPSLLGASGLLWGGAVARQCALPLLILYMAKPLPDVLMPKLFGAFQHLAAHASAWVLELSGTPTFISGNIIEVPGMKLLVEEACSGMRSVITLLTVALIILAISKHSPVLRGFIVLLSLSLALLLNIVRVTATGLLAYRIGPESAHGFMHTFSGLVTFMIGFVLLYSASRWIERRRRITAPASGGNC